MKILQFDFITLIFVIALTLGIYMLVANPQTKPKDKLPQDLHRAENHEVICYGMQGMGVWCTLKQPPFKAIQQIQ